jgi:RimJ/RimL family protein N-acetyltransferase
MIPRIETPRLVLRAHAPSDFAAYAQIWREEATTRFIGGKPLTEEESWAKFLRMVGQWHVMGFGFWAVEEKSSGRFIGDVGYVEGMRDIVPSLKGVPEIGWGLAPTAHGKGYAFEAAQAALKWGETHFGGAPIRCIISPQNAPSLKLAEKLGFKEIVRTTYTGDDIVMLERAAR